VFCILQVAQYFSWPSFLSNQCTTIIKILWVWRLKTKYAQCSRERTMFHLWRPIKMRHHACVWVFKQRFCYFSPILTKIGMCWQILVKISNMTFYKNLSCSSHPDTCRQMDWPRHRQQLLVTSKCIQKHNMHHQLPIQKYGGGCLFFFYQMWNKFS
jgi:hypothetical protein